MSRDEGFGSRCPVANVLMSMMPISGTGMNFANKPSDISVTNWHSHSRLDRCVVLFSRKTS